MDFLYISFFLPPLGGAEPRHNLSTIRRLCSHGFHPTVITAPLDFDHPKDPALADLMPPQADVLRVGWPHGGRKIVSKARELLRIPGNPLIFGGSGRLYEAARGALREGGHSFMYSVHGIGAAHLAALRLKRVTGLPWIAEFRDPWYHNAIAWKYLREKSWRWWCEYHRARTKTFTSRILSEADLIVVESPQHGECLIRDFGVLREKVLPCGMGFEPDYFSDLPPRQLDLPRRPVIGYVGYSYHGHEEVVGGFVHALRKLEKRGVKFTLVTVGDSSGTFSRAALETGLESFLPIGRVSLAMSLALMQGVDLGLVYRIPEDICNINSKLWEYLRSGVSLLALVPPGGAMATLIDEGRCGYLLPYDADAMADVLLAAIRDYGAGKLKRAAPEFIAQFSADRMVSELAERIREIVGKRRTR